MDFKLSGQAFNALSGGPAFQFTPAVSFVIDWADQADVDRWSAALSAVPEAEQCGWVQYRYGLSWQIGPKALAGCWRTPTGQRQNASWRRC